MVFRVRVRFYLSIQWRVTGGYIPTTTTFTTFALLLLLILLLLLLLLILQIIRRRIRRICNMKNSALKLSVTSKGGSLAINTWIDNERKSNRSQI